MGQAKLRKNKIAALNSVRTSMYNAAIQSGYTGVDFTGSEEFLQNVANVTLNTSANSEQRRAALIATFIAAAFAAGGKQAAEEMAEVLKQVA